MKIAPSIIFLALTIILPAKVFSDPTEEYWDETSDNQRLLGRIKANTQKRRSGLDYYSNNEVGSGNFPRHSRETYEEPSLMEKIKSNNQQRHSKSSYHSGIGTAKVPQQSRETYEEPSLMEKIKSNNQQRHSKSSYHSGIGTAKVLKQSRETYEEPSLMEKIKSNNQQRRSGLDFYSDNDVGTNKFPQQSRKTYQDPGKVSVNRTGGSNQQRPLKNDTGTDGIKPPHYPREPHQRRREVLNAIKVAPGKAPFNFWKDKDRMVKTEKPEWMNKLEDDVQYQRAKEKYYYSLPYSTLKDMYEGRNTQETSNRNPQSTISLGGGQKVPQRSQGRQGVRVPERPNTFGETY